jgi:hypothetical protein
VAALLAAIALLSALVAVVIARRPSVLAWVRRRLGKEAPEGLSSGPAASPDGMRFGRDAGSWPA